MVAPDARGPPDFGEIAGTNGRGCPKHGHPIQRTGMRPPLAETSRPVLSLRPGRGGRSHPPRRSRWAAWEDHRCAGMGAINRTRRARHGRRDAHFETLRSAGSPGRGQGFRRKARAPANCPSLYAQTLGAWPGLLGAPLVRGQLGQPEHDQRPPLKGRRTLALWTISPGQFARTATCGRCSARIDTKST